MEVEEADACKEQILNNNIDQSNNATINSHTLYTCRDQVRPCKSRPEKNLPDENVCFSRSLNRYFSHFYYGHFFFFHFQFSVFVRLWIFTIKHSHFTCENVHTLDNMRCERCTKPILCSLHRCPALVR